MMDRLGPGGACPAAHGETCHTSRNLQPRLVFTTIPPMSRIFRQTAVTSLGTGTGPIISLGVVNGSSQSLPGSIFLIQK